jgi:hypothetical protein
MRKWIVKQFITWLLNDPDTRKWFHDFLVTEFRHNTKLRQIVLESMN